MSDPLTDAHLRSIAEWATAAVAGCRPASDAAVRYDLLAVADELRRLREENAALAADRDHLRQTLQAILDADDAYHECGEGQYPGPVFDAIDVARRSGVE